MSQEGRLGKMEIGELGITTTKESSGCLNLSNHWDGHQVMI